MIDLNMAPLGSSVLSRYLAISLSASEEFMLVDSTTDPAFHNVTY